MASGDDMQTVGGDGSRAWAVPKYAATATRIVRDCILQKKLVDYRIVYDLIEDK